MFGRTMLGMSVLLPAGLVAGAQEVPPGQAAPLALGAGEIHVVLDPAATPVERRAAELFAAEVRRRTTIAVPVDTGGSATGLTLLVGTTPVSAAAQACLGAHPQSAPLGADGFRLLTAPDRAGRSFALGQSPSGVVAAMGKLLRLARYAEGRLTLPVVSLADAPRLPVRGLYLATHFHNFYHVAPLADVDAVIEEFALWGGNSLTVWFDMHHFAGLSDPAAQVQLARLRHFGETAHGVGLKFGLAFLANEAYHSSPEALRAKWLPGWPHYHVEICPATPEGLALIGKWQDELLAAFPAVDFIWTWPYDQGGCACEACRPWGANGFLVASEQLARLYRARFPHGDVWLSTWLFDSLEGGTGEYDGFLRYLRENKPAWITGILTGTHGDRIPHRLQERPEPDRYPLTCFPEISMYQMNPWGGYGANPLPGFCSRLAKDMRGLVQGGWPYSEGIYEDVNKFFWCRWYWDPNQSPEQVLAEYAAYYLAPEAIEDACRLFGLLEATHSRSRWHVRNLDAAAEAWALAQRIEARLSAWARASWRWRLLYLRAAIDNTFKTKGSTTTEAQAELRPWCEELLRLYHADPARTFIRPPDLPRLRPATEANLALGRPVTASSTHPDYGGCERAVVDGVYAEDDGENFWVHDVRQAQTAWLAVDLGGPALVREVHLQFRGIHGVFWFVPTTVGLSVSPDGVTYGPVASSDQVPREGQAYSPRLWSYALNQEGRFLRIGLGPSQHTAEPYPGTLELVEIEVLGERR